MASRALIVAGAVLTVGVGAWALATAGPHEPPPPPGPGPGPQQGPGARGPEGGVGAAQAGGSGPEDPGVQRTEVAPGDAPPTAVVAGNLALAAEATRIAGAVDGELPLAFEAGSTRFASPALAAGRHELRAFASYDGTLDLFARQFELARGQRLDLGVLQPLATEVATLRVVPRHARTAAPFAPEELTRSALSRRRADVLIAGVKMFAPIGADVSVRGVPVAGAPIEITGAPPTVRLDARTLALRRVFAPSVLEPGGLTELYLDFVEQANASVVVRWAGGAAGEVSIELWDRQWRDSVGTRSSGQGVARSRIKAAIGAHLAVARLLGADGRVVAFAAREIALESKGSKVELDLEPARSGRGVAPGFEAGKELPLALAAWPDQPLWRPVVGADGRFVVAGLPPGQSLVLVGEGGARPVHAAERGGELWLELAPQ